MNVVVGVSGSIAVYKAVEVMREIQKNGGNVKVVMTKSATRFISPLIFETLSGSKALVDVFDFEEPLAHISFAKWADVFLVAPATANTIVKLAFGIADNSLVSVALALPSSVKRVFVPAMNTQMFLSDQVQKSIEILKSYGWNMVEPLSGPLACGDVGKGKFPSVDVVVAHTLRRESLKGVKIVVSAGGTREYIDPVRFIGNASSGRMGIELARELWLRGAEVELVCGSVSVPVPEFIPCSRVETSGDMFEVLKEKIRSADVLVMSAAVSDFKPENTKSNKIKSGKSIQINLVPTIDIISELGKYKNANQVFVAFALETNVSENSVVEKAVRKNADFIVLNEISEKFSPIGGEDTEIKIYTVEGKELAKFKGSKKEAAKLIADKIERKLQDKERV